MHKGGNALGIRPSVYVWPYLVGKLIVAVDPLGFLLFVFLLVALHKLWRLQRVSMFLPLTSPGICVADMMLTLVLQGGETPQTEAMHLCFVLEAPRGDSSLYQRMFDSSYVGLVPCLLSPSHKLRLKKETTATSWPTHQNKRGIFFHESKPPELTDLMRQIHQGKYPSAQTSVRH